MFLFSTNLDNLKNYKKLSVGIDDQVMKELEFESLIESLQSKAEGNKMVFNRLVKSLLSIVIKLEYFQVRKKAIL